MTEHTPGHWRTRVKPADPGIISEHGDDPWTVESDGRLICRVMQQAGEEEANARLIAAAPETAAERDRLRIVVSDLLGAAEAVCNADDLLSPTECLPGHLEKNIRALRAAIARARG